MNKQEIIEQIKKIIRKTFIEFAFKINKIKYGIVNNNGERDFFIRFKVIADLDYSFSLKISSYNPVKILFKRQSWESYENKRMEELCCVAISKHEETLMNLVHKYQNLIENKTRYQLINEIDMIQNGLSNE